MTRLLIIRCADLYARFTPEAMSLVPLAKASVYPEDQLETVYALLERARGQFPSACIRRLILTEEDFA